MRRNMRQSLLACLQLFVDVDEDTVLSGLRTMRLSYEEYE